LLSLKRHKKVHTEDATHATRLDTGMDPAFKFDGTEVLTIIKGSGVDDEGHMKGIKGRVPDNVFVGDTPLFANSSKLAMMEFKSDVPNKDTFCICAQFSSALDVRTLPTFELTAWYGEENMQHFLETGLGVIFIVTVQDGILRFHSPVGLHLEVCKDEECKMLRFDALNHPAFWCEMRMPNGVQSIDGKEWA